jgi:Mor family transcriptional regulator
LQNRTFSEADLVFRDGLYHSFSHHGAFSHSHKDYCLKSIRSRFSAAASRIRQTDVFLITFGTAYVYRLQQTGEMVGNCHKFPSEVFDRFRLSVDDIVTEWSELIADLCKLNPSMKIVFTVSPIRHWRDGAHENQVSKSILHLAIDQLMAEFEDNLYYFPAYEIVMDELRDYRFYSEDMFHPSETAIDYLWKRFRESFFSPVTEKIISDWQPIYRSLNHKSLNFETHEYRSFLMQTLAKLEQFKEKYPFISCKKETELLLTLLDLV